MRDAKQGTYNGEPTFCTVNAYGDCPYCDQCNVCHAPDPMKDCQDFSWFFEGSWDYWLSLDDPPLDDDFDEAGFNPFLGMYDDDC